MTTKLLRSVLMLFIGFCLTAATVRAQTGTIQGQVIDQQTGEPLINANVFIESLMRGAATNLGGEFTIDGIPYGTYDLRVSYVGYQTKTVSVTVDESTESVEIMLSPQTGQLEELVVTGIGGTSQINELSYSAQNLDAEAVTESGSADLMASLSGKVAGLKVSSRNGMGGSTDIILRGINSLTGNNQVLFVVDGVPLSNERFNTGAQEQGFAGYDYGSTALDINPANIATMTILKGAAATALYGSRASNGAIIITTKQGAPAGEAVNVSFSTSVGFSMVDPETFPTYQQEYGAGYAPGFFTVANPWTDAPTDSITTSKYTADASFGERFDPNKMVYQWGAFYPNHPNYQTATPWMPAENGPIEFFETGTNVKNSLFIRGGINEGGGYYSLGYTQSNVRGVFPNSQLDKYKLSFAGGYDIGEQLRVEASVDYARTDGLGRPGRGYGVLMSNFRQWWQTNADILHQKAAYFRNNRNIAWNLVSDRSGAYFWNNPYFERYENYETDTRDRYVGYAEIQYDIADWLSLTGRTSYSGYSQLIEERNAIGAVGNAFYIRRTQDYSEYNFKLLARYNKQLSDKVGIDGVVGFNARRTHTLGISASTSGGLVTPGVYALDNSVNSILFPNETDRRLGVNGIFASFNVDYNNYLFLRLTGRRDKASSLPDGNNIYYYPSISGSVNFSEFVDADWLSFGKIRASWAQVGGTAPPLSLLDTYSRNPNFGGIGLFTLPSTKNNPNLKPEITQEWEVGLQLGFFNDRLYLDAAYYNGSTFNQIFAVSISNATGYDAKFVNAGEIANKGIELALRARPVVSPNFSWQVNINWSKNVSEVVELAPGIDYFELAAPQGGVSIGAKVGDPIGVLRGSGFVYNDQGQRVLNDDGTYKQSDPNTVLGTMIPDWRGGISNRFSYKNWSLNVLVDVRWGGEIFSLDQWYGQGTGLYPITAGLNNKGNPKRDPVDEGGGILLPGVTEDGSPNTTYISAYLGSGYHGGHPQAAYVYDASYIKLREVGITYNLPVELLESIGGIDRASISIVGRNLWIMHKNLPYADPEASLSAGNVAGYSGGNLPAIRNITFNIKLNF